MNINDRETIESIMLKDRNKDYRCIIVHKDTTLIDLLK